jgi:hypothetical protein
MKRFSLFISILFMTSISYGQRLNTPTLSPISKISQEIGLTEIKLTYSRPSAKGRTIFGALVPYDKIWRTGANASTRITFQEAAFIGGKSIEKGTYALYTIPGAAQWTIIVHSNIELRSLAGDAYNPEDDVFRFTVKPQATSQYIETFTMQFTDLKTSSFNLQLLWEHTLINIPIAVEVDKHITRQMTEFLQYPEKIPARTYFEAAQYYLNNNKDLNEALSWMDAALEKSPNNFRYGLLKAKIQAKKGDKKSALITIEQAHAWAKAAKNANYIEQTALFKASLLKKE